jgi:diacylglycerol O-acyltransferase / wax synthase
MAARERELRFERRMSDAEALMWNVEKDPWLNPNGGMVTFLDRALDIDQFRHRMRYAVAKIPRLRERVVPGFGRLSPPVWSTDTDFEFDYHLRHISLPPGATRRDVMDLATRIYEDPFDRTRPLWQFVVMDGLTDGSSALFWKMHHSITDGIGAIRLSELYMERDRDTALPPEVDLELLIAEAAAVEASEPTEEGGDRSAGIVGTAMRSAGHLWRRQIGIARRAAGEVALWGADPWRVKDMGEGMVGNVRSLYTQLGSEGEVRGGSPLWKNRSRHRHLEDLRVPLEDAKAAGKALGGSVNDFFVAGAVAGATAYHAQRGLDVDAFNISFVVSTRTDKAIGGNSFTPTRLQVPGAVLPPPVLFAEVRDRMAARRAGVRGEGALSGLAGIANLLPTSLVTTVARSQAGRMDFATSNLRAAPFPVFISGAEVLQNIPMGPVAGTAFNLTTISYSGSLDMGIFLDPAAVEDPAALRGCLEHAYGEMLEAGGIVQASSAERP